GPTGQSGGNSAFRLAGVWDRFTVGPDLAAGLAQVRGPVLLVDDLVDSRWTMTVAARALRQAGADAGLPLALAAAASRPLRRVSRPTAAATTQVTRLAGPSKMTT